MRKNKKPLYDALLKIKEGDLMKLDLSNRSFDLTLGWVGFEINARS